jgi:hypothetical protein
MYLAGEDGFCKMLAKLGSKIGNSFSKLVTEDWHYFSKLVGELHQLLRKKNTHDLHLILEEEKRFLLVNVFRVYTVKAKKQDFEQSGF